MSQNLYEELNKISDDAINSRQSIIFSYYDMLRSDIIRELKQSAFMRATSRNHIIDITKKLSYDVNNPNSIGTKLSNELRKLNPSFISSTDIKWYINKLFDDFISEGLTIDHDTSTSIITICWNQKIKPISDTDTQTLNTPLISNLRIEYATPFTGNLLDVVSGTQKATVVGLIGEVSNTSITASIKELKSKNVTIIDDNSTNPLTKHVLALFYLSNCGYSTQVLDTWKLLIERLKTMNFSDLKIVKIESQFVKTEFNIINGYPIIKFYPCAFPLGINIKYEGDRSVESLLKFINDHYNM